MLRLWPFVVSVLLHAALVALLRRAPVRLAEPPPRARDAWAGHTIDVESVRVPLPESVTRAERRAQRSQPSPAHASSPRGQALGAGTGETRPAPAARASDARLEVASDFGSEGLPAGVRRLAAAFARAIPAATSRDPVWLDLPLGEAGSTRVAIELDDGGRIVDARVQSPERAPEPLQRLVARTVVLLRSGRFALSAAPARADTEVLSIELRVSAEPPSREFAPSEPVQLGFEPPLAGRRGRAYFTLGSGRHVDAFVSVVHGSR